MESDGPMVTKKRRNHLLQVNDFVRKGKRGG